VWRDKLQHAIDFQGTVKTLELLRFQSHQQRGIKPRFQFGLVLLKNRSFGTDFDNHNTTGEEHLLQS